MDIDKVKAYLTNELCDDDNRFLVPFVESYIARCDLHNVIKEGHVVIHYVLPRREAKFVPSVAYMNTIATRINILLKIYEYAGETMTFWVLPIREPRRFPKDGELFQPIHINGAYTYRDAGPPRIYVYRCEEMAKVMIHEVCHHLPMHSPYWSGNARLCHEFDIADYSKTLPNEAVIEFWAEILHCAFIGRHIEHVATLIDQEVEHGLSKSRKLLEYKKKLGGGPWNEHTNAFSYVVWRTVLLYFYKDFLKLSMPYDTDMVSDFIIERFRDPNFQRDLWNAPLPRTRDMRMTVNGD